jgi:uncharacterized membrane protein YidH (DUF202 family)
MQIKLEIAGSSLFAFASNCIQIAWARAQFLFLRFGLAFERLDATLLPERVGASRRNSSVNTETAARER